MNGVKHGRGVDLALTPTPALFFHLDPDGVKTQKKIFWTPTPAGLNLGKKLNPEPGGVFLDPDPDGVITPEIFSTPTPAGKNWGLLRFTPTSGRPWILSHLYHYNHNLIIFIRKMVLTHFIEMHNNVLRVNCENKAKSGQ